jgi:chemotaxis response regulator CheB
MQHSPRAPLRIYLAEESDAIVAQLRAWSAQSNGSFLIEAFRSGRQLVRQVEIDQPDLVLADLALPRMDGLTALRLLQPSGVPVVIVSPPTQEGARGAMEALVAGASDCLVKRMHQASERLAISRAEFLRRLEQWAETGAPTPPMPEDGAWYRLALDARGRLVAGLPTAQPYPRDEAWLGLALCRTQSLGRLLRAFALAPDRPSGGMLIGTCLPESYTRALAETAARCWNRAVLELRPGESVRPGQWRIIPGRAVLRPSALSESSIELDWDERRWGGERQLLAQRIDALRAPMPVWMRLYLFDEPERRLQRPLRGLCAASGAVLLHGDRFPLRQWMSDREAGSASRDRSEEAAHAHRPAA